MVAIHAAVEIWNGRIASRLGLDVDGKTTALGKTRMLVIATVKITHLGPSASVRKNYEHYTHKRRSDVRLQPKNKYVEHDRNQSANTLHERVSTPQEWHIWNKFRVSGDQVLTTTTSSNF